jgi:hypothetical protein
MVAGRLLPSDVAPILAGFDRGCADGMQREDRLRGDLAMLAGQLGRTSMPEPLSDTDPYAARLTDIYDKEVEQAGRDACQRDYLAFGFGDWQSP